MFSLKEFQKQVGEWSTANFGEGPYWQKFFGVVEEVGELAHSLLKQEQGIRGTFEEHEEVAKDSVGDIMVYLADLCYRRGWDLEAITEETWGQVMKRNWKENPVDGS